MLSNPNIIRGSLRDLAISWLAPAHFFYPEEGHHAFLLSFFKGDTIEFDSGWKLTKKFSFLFHCWFTVFSTCLKPLWMCCIVKIQITGSFSHIVSSFLGRRSTAHSGKVSWEILTIMAMTVRDGGSWRRRGSEKQKIGNSDLTLYAKVA